MKTVTIYQLVTPSICMFEVLQRAFFLNQGKNWSFNQLFLKYHPVLFISQIMISTLSRQYSSVRSLLAPLPTSKYVLEASY